MGAHQKSSDDGSGISPRCFVRGCFKDGMGTGVRVAPDVEFRLILCDPHRLELARFSRRLERAAQGLPPVPLVAPRPPMPRPPAAPPKATLVPLDACVVCDVPFPPAGASGPRRKTCGNKCRMALLRARREGTTVPVGRYRAALREVTMRGEEIARLERELATAHLRLPGRVTSLRATG